MAGRCILQPIRRPGRRGLLPGVVSPKRYPDISSILATARGSHGPCVGQTLDPPVVCREPEGFITEDGGPSKSRRKRFGEPHASASPPRAIRPNAPQGSVHDRGRCPLYVRVQLQTAGLRWTHWDLAAPKATARKTGNPQLTDRLCRWWQVLGSNQRRLSRRFYRASALMIANLP